MALSGSVQSNFGGAAGDDLGLRIEWSATQNIVGNYSTVTAEIYLMSNKSWSAVYASANNEVTLNINGNTTSGWQNAGIGNNTSKWLLSHTVRVYHNSDGAKNFSISGSFNLAITYNGAWIGTRYVSDTWNLNTIPRASNATIVTSNIQYGGDIVVNLNRASSTFTHWVSIDIGDVLTDVGGMDNVTDSFTFNLPLDWIGRIPNLASNWGKFNVHTYDANGNYLGSSETWFQAKVPDNIVPVINTSTVTEAVAGLAAQFGAFVQSKSKLALAMTASGVYSSTISAYKITANGSVYGAASATTAEVVNSGAQNVVFEATDSRGRKVSVIIPITVQPYTAPSITSFTAVRADETGAVDDEGTYAKVDYIATMSPVNGGNTKTLFVRYKKTNEETWSEAVVTNAAFDNLSGGALIPGFDIDYAYDVAFVLTDYFNTVPKEAIPPLPTGFTLTNYHTGGRGMAFGKVASGPGFDNGLMTWFTGGIEAVELLTGDGSLAYWQTVNGGYYYATLGSVTGQPSPSGLIQVIRQGTDFSVIWHDLTSQNVYRLYGSSATLNEWVQVNGTPATFVPTLLNGWINYGDGFATAEYWKDSDDMVHIKGLIKDGNSADGTVIFTLPVGFRPALKEIFTITANNAYGRVDVNDNGNVVTKLTSATYTSLSGISFRAEN